MSSAPDISLRLISDAPGRIEASATPRLFLAIHVGRSVNMICERGGRRHRGLFVHGDIDIVPPNTPSVWEPEEADTALIVSLGAGLMGEAAKECGYDSAVVRYRNRFQIRDAQLESIAWSLKAEMESGYESGPVFLRSLALALAVRLARRHSSIAEMGEAKLAISGHRLKQVISHIEDNLSRDLSLREIAGVAGLSVSHCKSIFRVAMGVPIHRYVIQRRVERAKTMLCKSDAAISTIAEETGFAHQSHLASHMKKLLGCSPKAIRNEHRSGTYEV